MNGMLSRNANRHPMVSTIVPPTNGPSNVRADVADAQPFVALGLSRPPALVGRQVGQVGTMPLARVQDVEPSGPECRKNGTDRLDGSPREGQIIAHRIDVTAFTAEIGLHVDDDEGGVAGPQVAVERPRIGVGGDELFLEGGDEVHACRLTW